MSVLAWVHNCIPHPRSSASVCVSEWLRHARVGGCHIGTRQPAPRLAWKPNSPIPFGGHRTFKDKNRFFPPSWRRTSKGRNPKSPTAPPQGSRLRRPLLLPLFCHINCPMACSIHPQPSQGSSLIGSTAPVTRACCQPTWTVRGCCPLYPFCDFQTAPLRSPPIPIPPSPPFGGTRTSLELDLTGFPFFFFSFGLCTKSLALEFWNSLSLPSGASFLFTVLLFLEVDQRTDYLPKLYAPPLPSFLVSFFILLFHRLLQ